MSGFFDNIASLAVEEPTDNFLEDVVKACEEEDIELWKIFNSHASL